MLSHHIFIVFVVDKMIEFSFFLKRYVLWASEDNAVRVLIPDIFALIRKKALSNNVGTHL